MSKKTDTLSALVHDETRALEKSALRTYIVSALLAVVLFGYLGFIYSSFKEMLEPEELSSILINEAQSMIDQAIDTYEKEVADAAPKLAEYLNDRIMNDLIPSVGEIARGQIDQTHQQWIPSLGEEFASYFATYFASNEEALRQIADLEEDRMAEAFVAEIMREWNVQWDSALREIHPENKGLAYFREGFDTTLGAMDLTLTKLIESDLDSLDHRERLQRRILAQLVHRFIEVD